MSGYHRATVTLGRPTFCGLPNDGDAGPRCSAGVARPPYCASGKRCRYPGRLSRRRAVASRVLLAVRPTKGACAHLPRPVCQRNTVRASKVDPPPFKSESAAREARFQA
jgi:hypothetical protein